MENVIIDSIGWVGSIVLVIGYWSISKKWISSDSSTYHSINILGSILIIINSMYYKAFPSVAVNIIWIIIGTFYITKQNTKNNEASTN